MQKIIYSNSPVIKELLELKGFEKLNEMQEAAETELNISTSNDSIVICAPTASGKSLLAEIAVLKTLKEGKKAVWTTPLRALAEEKRRDMEYLRKLNYTVGISTGDYDNDGSDLGKYDLIFTTNERLDSLMRQQAKWLSSIGLIISDEVHTIQDRKRGAVIDVVLTRSKFFRPRPRIIALSATIKNPDELSYWLDAKTFQSNWRPVPLEEYVVFKERRNIVILSKENKVQTKEAKDPLQFLIKECVDSGASVLVFTNTRKSAQTVARTTALKFEPGNTKEVDEEILSDELMDSKEVLDLLKRGIGYHHAGLPHHYRKMIEDSFRQREIKVISATTTLAAGLNLPSRRVIIKDISRWDKYAGRTNIKVYEYKQMVGRAGRPGLDPYGESFIIAKDAYDAKFLIDNYVNGEPEVARSTLLDVRTYPSQILSLIYTKMATSREDILKFVEHTFGGRQFRKETIWNITNEHLEKMARAELLEQDYSGRLEPTILGSLTAQLYIHPETTMRLLDLKDVSEGVEVSTEGKEADLLTYLFLLAGTMDLSDEVPYSIGNEEHDQLNELAFKHKIIIDDWQDSRDFYKETKAFKRALILNEWINGTFGREICIKFKMEPGDLLRLIENSEWIAYACQRLSTSSLKISGDKKVWQALHKRIEYGLPEQAMPLTVFNKVKRFRAMNIMNHMNQKYGKWTLEDVKNLPIGELTGIPGIGEKIANWIKYGV
ncbi:DEAD/DEAH box helicase [Candidatus Micrarchaeota archaeon]|nr:DEAD/DEAH box helicase [Candidatus Micrarchaeota archaeon]